MDTLEKKLTEVKAVFWSIKLYKVILDLLVGFIAGAIVFQILRFNILFAILPAAIFAMLELLREYLKRDMMGNLHGRYDNLEERLKTALENKDRRNIIVSDLVGDVSQRMDGIETSVFFRKRDISIRVFAVLISCFILLTVTVLDLRNLTLDSLKRLLEDPSVRGTLDNLLGDGRGELEMFMGGEHEKSNWTSSEEKKKLGSEAGGETPGYNEGPIAGQGGGKGYETGADIFGDAQSASLFGKDVDFNLHPEYGGDIEIRETGGRAKVKRFDIDEVQSVEECAECVVGPENEEVVRNYFELILPGS